MVNSEKDLNPKVLTSQSYCLSSPNQSAKLNIHQVKPGCILWPPVTAILHVFTWEMLAYTRKHVQRYLSTALFIITKNPERT